MQSDYRGRYSLFRKGSQIRLHGGPESAAEGLKNVQSPRGAFGAHWDISRDGPVGTVYTVHHLF